MLSHRNAVIGRRTLTRTLALALCATLFYALAPSSPIAPPRALAQKSDTADVNATQDSAASAATIEAVANDTPQTATPLRFGSVDADAGGAALMAASQEEGATPHYASVAGQSISPIGDQDYYSFSVSATVKFSAYVDTGGAQGSGATSRDSLLVLYAPDGTTVIEQDDDDGTGNGGDGTIESNLASVIVGRTLTPGTYYLRVSKFNDNGIINPYQLFASVSSVIASESEPNDSLSDADLLSDNATYTGAVSSANPLDFYGVPATTGQRLLLTLDEDPGRDGSGTTELSLALLNNSGTLLFEVNPTSSDPKAEAFSYVVPTSSTYYVRVQYASGSSGGDYNLTVTAFDDRNSVRPQPGVMSEVETNDTPAQAMGLLDDLRAGIIVAGAINPGDDADYYSFTTSQFTRLHAYVDTGGTPIGSATSRDSLLTLFAPDGTTVLAEDDDDGTGNGGDGTIETLDSSALAVTMPSGTATYYLRVKHADKGAGVINPYRLYVVVAEALTVPEFEPNLTFNEAQLASDLYTISGALSSSTDQDVYRVEARAGQVIYVNVLSAPEGNTYPDIRLSLDVNNNGTPEGRVAADSAPAGSSATSAVESFAFNVTETRTYYLSINGVGSQATGRYLLLFKTLRGSDIAQTLYPTADSYVVGAEANRSTNYGTAAEMQVKRTLNPGAGRGRRGYLRFTINEIDPTDIPNVKLRLYARLSEPSLANVPVFVAYFTQASAPPWTETGITWNNQPSPPDATFTNLGTLTVRDSTPRWYEFDITSLVRDELAAGRITISLRLVNTVATGMSGASYTSVNSREATANRPHLIVYRR